MLGSGILLTNQGFGSISRGRDLEEGIQRKGNLSGHLCPFHNRKSDLTSFPLPKSTSQSCVIVQECCKRICDKTTTRIFDIFKGKAIFLLFFDQTNIHVFHSPVSSVTMTLFPLCISRLFSQSAWRRFSFA